MCGMCACQFPVCVCRLNAVLYVLDRFVVSWLNQSRQSRQQPDNSIMS